ncbi:type VI secretion system baseplate subunit TssE [Luteibacter aegosomatis]|uniref:type VI secretion system baseplate subunit TssE n=1 Tax=Luteibacter aegosomatis TaxID=2911537 RepID=UPI001FF8BD3C|nr:type VI secretion system baseplate subunit TssE [Luteibacter aegosomatis]UPG84799.1 type VI secretion system baseplate subunit TssE [Luteibacter aegosomatis]
MADLSTQERLQPSLLDRLRDDEPHVAQEGREQRVMTSARLREYVARDLGWLFNCTRPPHAAASGLPHVEDSTLGYGIPDLAGGIVAGMDMEAFRQGLRAAIVRFEPRLEPDSLRVSVEVDAARMDHLTMSFRIESTLWAQPLPLGLYLKTEVDLQTARFSVFEGLG